MFGQEGWVCRMSWLCLIRHKNDPLLFFLWTARSSTWGHFQQDKQLWVKTTMTVLFFFCLQLQKRHWLTQRTLFPSDIDLLGTKDEHFDRCVSLGASEQVLNLKLLHICDLSSSTFHCVSRFCGGGWKRIKPVDNDITARLTNYKR